MIKTAKLVCALFLSLAAFAQSSPREVTRRIDAAVQSPDVAAHRIRQYLMKIMPRLAAPASPAAWTAEAQRLRQHTVDEVIFKGWPKEWVEARPRFEDLGPIAGGDGFRRRKLRYEIVPGFWSTAILYEPEKMAGRIPAVLNVNGHVGAPGKAVEYKQKRCINQAKLGMLALDLEWPGMGELSQPENRHWYGAHLDLVGANGVGFFFLSMRKGIDYLWEHPNADRARIAVTGLSGGGWQTIVLSSLDERVTVSIPVAGYMDLPARIQPLAEVGDIEQNGTDLLARADYAHMTAMRAPRPTLLIYNNEDDCCFRAPTVKPGTYDAVKPFFRLYGKEDVFVWHENTDPNDHNYQLDNRQAAYRFLTKHFGLPVAEKEIFSDHEILSYEDLRVGVPADNLTILGLARKLAAREAPAAGDARAALGVALRYKEVKVDHAWPLWNSKHTGLETLNYVFEFTNGLSATAFWMKAIAAPEAALATIVLDDKGKKAAAREISERVNRGEQVLGLDLLFFGDSAPAKPPIIAFTQFLGAAGDRPLGLEAAQLVAVARWARQASAGKKVRVESRGIRNQVIALAAAALAPELFGEVVIRDGMSSLRHLLDAPVEYSAAPDLFCLGLYPRFDVDRLQALAAPVKVTKGL